MEPKVAYTLHEYPAQCFDYLMQYTGLKDKNGVEIYEGDIILMLCNDWISKLDTDTRTLEQYLRDKADKFAVAYNPSECAFVLRFNGDADHERGFYGFMPHGFIEVIGNIYQNPELLNTEAQHDR